MSDNIPSDLLVPRIYCVRFGQAVVIDHDSGARFQSWDELLEHLCAVLVRLVVADPAKEVHICILDWLLRVKVVRLELDAIKYFWWCPRRAISYSFGQVLHNKAEFWKLVRQRDTNESVRAANLVRGSEVSVSKCGGYNMISLG
jgi:hypothetical protein